MCIKEQHPEFQRGPPTVVNYAVQMGSGAFTVPEYNKINSKHIILKCVVGGGDQNFSLWWKREESYIVDGQTAFAKQSEMNTQTSWRGRIFMMSW
jgi:hypothetical protein